MALALRRPNVNLYAAVELAAFRRVVGRLRTRLAISDRGDARGRNALRGEVILHAVGTALGEILVVCAGTDVVCVALVADRLVGVALGVGREVAKRVVRLCWGRGGGEIEPDVVVQLGGGRGFG